MSPEMLIQNAISEKSDMWSLGATILEVCTLEQVFDEPGATEYRKAVVKNIRSKKPDGINT